MRIKYFADIRTLSGCLEQEWTRPAPTLRELVLGLAEQHGAAFSARTTKETRKRKNEDKKERKK
jgi:molybdopterin converting factor small subunit